MVEGAAFLADLGDAGRGHGLPGRLISARIVVCKSLGEKVGCLEGVVYSLTGERIDGPGGVTDQGPVRAGNGVVCKGLRPEAGQEPGIGLAQFRTGQAGPLEFTNGEFTETFDPPAPLSTHRTQGP